MYKLANALIKAVELHGKLTQSEVQQDLISKIKLWGAGIFRLVVMGEIKKGKSSFINALLNTENLVPVADEIATSTVFKIHYASELNYKVHFLPYTEKAPLSITPKEVEQYGTEKGNPSNHYDVDFIEVGCPAALLKAGLFLIDTPGLGGLFKAHKRITWQCVPKADAVAFITDCSNPIGKSEIDHIETVLKITQRIFFIHTKAATVDGESLQSIKQNNLNILAPVLKKEPQDIPYFEVDSELLHLAADDEELLSMSNYPIVHSFLSGTSIKEQHRFLASKAVQATSSILCSLRENLQARKATIASDTIEKQEQAKADIEAAEKELEAWKRGQRAELSESMLSKLKRLQKECLALCEDLRQFGDIHQAFDLKIENAATEKELKNILNTINEELPALAAERITIISKTAESGVSDIFSELADQTNSQAQNIEFYGAEASGLRANGALKRTLNTLAKGRSSFENARAMILGAGVGGSICSVIGGVLGSVVPIIGTITGSIFGVSLASLWCGKKALDVTADNVLKSYKNQSHAAVSQAMGILHADLQLTINNMFSEYGDTFRKALSAALLQHAENLERRRIDLRNRCQMNTANLKQAQAELFEDEKAVSEILKVVSPWLQLT